MRPFFLHFMSQYRVFPPRYVSNLEWSGIRWPFHLRLVSYSDAPFCWPKIWAKAISNVVTKTMIVEIEAIVGSI